MKSNLKNTLVFSALVASLGLMRVANMAAQTFTTLHRFAATDPVTGVNFGGANPAAGLTLADNTLFGTAQAGTPSRNGTVFAVSTDGTVFRTLHDFAIGAQNEVGTFTNSDGANPVAGLLLSGATLYGTTQYGGKWGAGTVFKINTNGSSFATLHFFTAPVGAFRTNGDGANPSGGLVLSGDTLYGTAQNGGTSGFGTVFSVGTNGTEFMDLHDFAGNDEGNPVAGLILSSNTLFGTTYGSDDHFGTVFANNTDGTGFTNLYNFTDSSDGANPVAGLTLSSNTLYGTAQFGGGSDMGTVFSINTDGTGFTTLHEFEGGSDGRRPKAGLVLSNNTLYGTAIRGGNWDDGTVFAVDTGGGNFTALYSFFGSGDGELPVAGLVLSDNTLYGTTFIGASGTGVVFSLGLTPTPAPQITITPSGGNIIVTWPTNSALTLQSTTSLGSSAIWTPVSTPPTVVDDQNTVTNVISGSQQFFRLGQ
jgi:uncharacterized repeat protein (TIGR03803 family)